MKKIFLLQTISLLLISSNIYAQEKTSLTLSNKKPSNTQSQILPYKEGNYSILFYDMEGNEIEGNFLTPIE